MKIINSFKKYIDEYPIATILIIALIPRLIAAFFSKGYGMHDDHFGPIEMVNQILHDWSIWENRGEPHGHSALYPGLHFYFFKFLNSINITDPQTQMLWIRLIHAFYSLITVYFSYKIAERLSNKELAKKIGIVVALFWIFPFMSVRNLIEMVCVPPLMAGFYYTLVSDEKKKNIILVGIFFGLSFPFRYHTLVIPGTIFWIMIFKKEFKNSFLLLISTFFTILLVQGTVDYLVWGYPGAAFYYYFVYNATHSREYTTGPWYNYLLLMFGVLLPPLSALLLYGFVKNWKKYLIIFLPTIVFLLLHSYYPNKQERFVLPIMPIIIVMSFVGWEIILSKYRLIENNRILKLNNIFTKIFWVINFALLILFSTTYSKKTRVESMYYLSNKADLTGVYTLSGRYGFVFSPTFYMNKWDKQVIDVTTNDWVFRLDTYKLKNSVPPNYLIIYGEEELQRRLKLAESQMQSKLNLIKIIEPSFIDMIFHYLNPKFNKNQSAYIYRKE